AIAARQVDEIVTVSEEELANAILLLLEIEKTVVEGAGAAALAALINRPLGLAGARIVMVMSGGNIDITMLSRIIERGLVTDGRLVRLGVLLPYRPGELGEVARGLAGVTGGLGVQERVIRDPHPAPTREQTAPRP